MSYVPDFLKLSVAEERDTDGQDHRQRHATGRSW